MSIHYNFFKTSEKLASIKICTNFIRQSGIEEGWVIFSAFQKMLIAYDLHLQKTISMSNIKLSIPSSSQTSILTQLGKANKSFQQLYPGESLKRQPVHTVYGGAQLFSADTAPKMGLIALKNLKSYAPNFVVFAKALALAGHESLPDDPQAINSLIDRINKQETKAPLSYLVYHKVLQKLEKEAIEDFRIDFEDGFGNRPDEEEDEVAYQAALEVVKGMQKGSLSPYIGIRIKTFTEELKERAVRTLDIFLSTLLNHSDGKLPQNFVITLPKVTIPEQVTALVRLLEIIEQQHQLAAGSLKIEIMVETTQSIMDAQGNNALRALVAAGEGRCTGAHFGTYDYTASCNITAKYQTMDHQVCDFAHQMMKVALTDTGVWLSDGATNIMPVGPHRGKELSQAQLAKNQAVVHRAWKISYDHIRHSLWKGIYQGWDLHPAQLPIRYAAVYTFFLESYEEAALRLRSFVEQAAQASLSGDIFDDAATGQGLLNYFLKALNCGAISLEEAQATGLSIAEITSKSFVKILAARRG